MDSNPLCQGFALATLQKDPGLAIFCATVFATVFSGKRLERVKGPCFRAL